MVSPSARGFTLVEMLMSLAISTTLIVVMLGLSTTHVSLANATTNRVTLTAELVALNDYFSREILNSGGEYLPVWAAIAVEDNCGARGIFPDCKETDRLTLIKPVNYQSCQVASSTATTLRFDLAACCLKNLDLTNHQIMVVQNGEVAQKFVTGVDLNLCQAKVIPGPLAFRDTKPASYDWSQAAAMPVLMQTYYLNPQSAELTRVTYVNPTPDPNARVVSALIDGVIDFQVALGFDFDPEDGLSTDAASPTDEWLYNSPTGIEAMGAGKFSGLNFTMLKMVNVAVSLGLPSSNPAYRHQAQLLNGPLVQRPDMMMDSGWTKLMLRSLKVFQ